MANQSIFNAFERMWQHIIVALNNKQNKITGAEGQVIGFDENGSPIAQDIATENWTFTLEDGSTVDKAVHVG